ncbi:hypothetical protein IAE19_03725 [Acinetobacter sp. S40]|uniref:hypothetical protein n=1 Tax=unclassified Acinetobacter TaxID=196816 RepID=UPI00190E4124|nr:MULTISPECIES: hypothetical protein [unclassified Acinetobacter]MBJ9984548.1 hypothetical protein [Acinetobacter sp. S40]MBK0062265.1 hypothetical protein [Acinetobacter sp. S55]MBK0066069.1 hypothetical protein [Acinetobacter sp. S54]
MLKTIIALGCLAVTATTFANSDQAKYQSFIPKNWKIIETGKGDLNQDGMEDLALVIEENNPEKIISNDRLGSPELNTNPRALLVLFRTAQGYQLISKSLQLPSENDADSPCLADPLEDGGIMISKGILKINLHYWLSCGSWYVTNNNFSFRYQNGKFKLIGFDQNSFHRASGEESGVSINFLTGKLKKTTDGNEFEETAKPARVEWKKLKQHYDLNLEHVNFKEPPEFQ